MLKRRDFTFRGLLAHEGTKELPLFSDLGEDVFIPRLEVMRLVANCAKHSEGSPADSCAKLRDRRPEFFTRPEVDANFVYPKALQPLAGEGLFVTG